ncbi:hypothetical protein [Phenylobacterium sp.]|uniref:hypothetical protein n=1 Tax=Phenylobacterium sp. TaxID=1871053 RepID=UPI002E33757A|nr:hypothetical protein [Phenylobacterium sp.]HEX2559864.1 hypothetical protein [Phenylobacterium sp.]
MFVRIEDFLSSASNAAGDRFSISLDEEIDLGGGRVIPAGYRGVGEVTHAQKRGFMGKAGELNVNLNYIRVGDTRIRLRGSRNREGEGRLGTTVVLTVLFGPLGLLFKGKDIEVPRGQRIPAYVDTDADIALPAAPPPQN